MRHTIASPERHGTGTLAEILALRTQVRDSIPIGHAGERIRF